MTKKAKTGLLCNMTYTDQETGIDRLCQDGAPRPAAYVGFGARVCLECWPDVKAGFTARHGPLGAVATEKAFRRIKA